MKIAFLTVILVATLAGVSFGQAGVVWLSSDPAGYDCLLDDRNRANQQIRNCGTGNRTVYF